LLSREAGSGDEAESPRPDRSSGGGGRGAAIFLRRLIAIVAAVTDAGEPAADFVGFGCADGGVAGEGFLPVVPGLKRVAVSLAGAGEAAVRAGLLQRRVGLGCEPESGSVVRACLVGVACPDENVTEAVECVGLQNPIADLAEDGQGLLKVADSLLVAAEPQVSFAEPGQDLGFAGCAADILEQG
jgi:hypothetical protein